ncbi:hypothetical protein B0T18DRAFT_386137 [Schizothecium vesticola]|uniref:F-box domain-containing protein n=1 Tax=Schizothecium vesticola TaxID=314040 RepID=A0AA40FAI6_9PEZI|nr:hypothetical protein B0T18DRAFT_386137 [Schizothecium vesticola]
MFDAPSTHPSNTGMSLTSFPSELLAEITEHALQPNFYFMTLLSVNDDQCQAHCTILHTHIFSTAHAHWQIHSNQQPPPIALTCRALYAEWVRLKRKDGVGHRFACGHWARVNPPRDIFVLRIDPVDQRRIQKMGYACFWKTLRVGFYSPYHDDRSRIRHVALEPLYFPGGGSNFEIRHLLAFDVFPALETVHILIRDVPATRATPPLKVQNLELSPFPDTLDAVVPGGGHKRAADLEIDARKPRIPCSAWWGKGREHPAVSVQVHLMKSASVMRDHVTMPPRMR